MFFVGLQTLHGEECKGRTMSGIPCADLPTFPLLAENFRFLLLFTIFRSCPLFSEKMRLSKCSAVIKCAFVHALHYAWISNFVVCWFSMTSGYRSRAIDNKLQYRACSRSSHVQKQWQPSCSVSMCLLCTQDSCHVRYRNRRWQAKILYWTYATRKKGNYDHVTSMFMA